MRKRSPTPFNQKKKSKKVKILFYNAQTTCCLLQDIATRKKMSVVYFSRYRNHFASGEKREKKIRLQRMLICVFMGASKSQNSREASKRFS